MKRKRKERRPVHSMTAVTVRLGALLLVLWLVCMGFLTIATAEYVMRDIIEKGQGLASSVSLFGGLKELYNDDSETREKHPGIVDYCMLYAIDWAGVAVSPPPYHIYPDPDVPEIFRDLYPSCQTAVVFVDSEGQVIHQSGDYLYFEYVTEDVWLAQEEEKTERDYGWIDLGDGEDERYLSLRTLDAGTYGIGSAYAAMRLTGYFDGSCIEPLALAVLPSGTVELAVDSMNSEYVQYTLSSLDAEGRVEWDVRFDHTADAPADKEPVTVYALRFDMELYDPGGSITYQGCKYDTLLACLTEPCEPFLPTGYGSSEFYLTRTTVFDYHFIRDYSDYDPYTSTEYPEPVFTVMTAVTANPVLIAMSFLRNVYIITFTLTQAGFLLLRGAVKKHLVKPLAEINGAMANDWAYVQTYRDKDPKWREPRELVERYRQTTEVLRVRKNEITRLNTALEYAKTAEENRRQMVSHIAHEFKTPLAVIHSYAEGLNEHIAEGKREKYVEVILSESERLDAMVLELLDLSRLEAGKVKLARDEFDLCALARSVFERLEMAAQAKGLNIELDFPEVCLITADEGRLRQVIENFASNAVKYTPAGGNLRAQISVTARSGVTFAVENDSEPFSQEVLSKVWDTFYRTDSARTGQGTGLGLAIAKNIVELHGGKCAVRNTKTGVEFSFTL